MAAVTWVVSVGDVTEYFMRRMPPGQTFYIFSKLAGLTAGAMLSAQIVLMVARNATWFRSRFAWNTGQHVTLGLLTLAALLLHVGLFIAAASLRGAAPAFDLLLPVFGHDPYRTGVSLGSLGVWMLVATVPIGIYMRRVGITVRRRAVHSCAAGALALGIIHALVIGSEKSTIIALAVCGVAVVVALGQRWVAGRGACE